VAVQVSVILRGVSDGDRAGKFSVDGLGCVVEQDYPGFVSGARSATDGYSSDPDGYLWKVTTSA